MLTNPTYRYATIPVQLPGQKAVAYVVRVKRKNEAIKKVAGAVDPEAIIDLQKARTFDTKREAKAYAKDEGLDVVTLDFKKKLLR